MKKFVVTAVSLFVILMVSAQVRILPPELVAPANGAANRMPDVLLDWDAVSGIGTITYELQYDTSESFVGNPVFINTTSYKCSELLFGTTFYWRVRATDDLGTSDWSEIYNFSTFDQLTLDKPTEGATDQVPNVKLEWKKSAGTPPVNISGITFYDFELSLDSSFADPQHGSVSFSVFSANAATHYGFASQLLFDTTYLWRARARHGADTTQWSDLRSFSTLQKVTLSSPANNATGQMLDVQINWNNITGTFGYLFELSKEPNFLLPIMSAVDTNFAIPDMLEFGETYYWRVNAYHNYDTTIWSDAWSFTTVNEVTLTSPANGDTVSVFLPKLVWQPLTGITKYELQYDLDNTFTGAESHFIMAGTSEYQTLSPLDAGKKYYWRVRAIQDGDTTNWSELNRHFYSPPEVGISTVTLDNGTVSVFPNPAERDITVSISTARTMECRIMIVDLLGSTFLEEVYSFGPDNRNHQIPLDGLTGGVYLVRIQNDREIYTQKLVVR